MIGSRGMYVRVAVPIPSSKTFTYKIPEKDIGSAGIGKRVLVPLGKRRATGWIIEAPVEASTENDIKEILSVFDEEALFSAKDLPFFEWVSDYYLYPLGMVLSEALPGGVPPTIRRRVRLALQTWRDDESLTTTQRTILKRLASARRGLSLNALRRIAMNKVLSKDLRFLEEAGFIVSEEIAKRPTWTSGHHPNFDPNIPESYSDAVETKADIILNNDQKTALDEIKKGLSSQKFSPYVLHGVTGSGKTEIYLRAMMEVINRNGGIIYLVPEIALTVGLIRRVQGHFPNEPIAVLHSGISNSVRHQQWERIKRGEIRIVIGARSAIFAPVGNLRLIIVDEEHDTSYKQDDRLRYNGRDLALVRAKNSRAVVILGSATPGVQTYFYAMSGIYKYLHLPLRANDRPLPKVFVVDMRQQRDKKGRIPIFSDHLIAALEETLKQKNQALLFLNRRGYHTFVFCSECGHVFNCPSCDVALTYHASQGVLKCHHCDFTTKIPTICPVCGSKNIKSQGTGTERLVEETRRHFPDATLARIDSDTSSRKGSTERTLRDFAGAKIDILVGTQMLAKGHDFPGITLVGVVAADSSLNMPDFRAAERTFQLLMQVAGRGGRGDKPAEVIIQTFSPDHYSIRRAQEHNYIGFYNDELPARRQFNYPPYSRLISLHLSSLNREKGGKTVAGIAETARKIALNLTGGKVDIIGPAECPLHKLRGRYRWQMLVRGKDGRSIHQVTKKLVEEIDTKGMEIRLDVDPVHFM